jgi:hypothetical protein
MTATEARPIIKTATSGWYLDPATGKKTRKQDGDRVFENDAAFHSFLSGENTAATAETNGAQESTARMREKAPEETETVISDTGKVLVGPLTTIKCQHPIKDPETGRKRKCGAERTVKVQDAKQTTRCVPHQQEHRKEISKQKAKAKRAAAKAKG